MVACSFWGPQGTVLGPILFLMFIDDVPTNITSSIKLFADGCVPYPPINSVSDQFALQRDLDQLEKWASTWPMKFAPTKCFVMSVMCSLPPKVPRRLYNMHVKLAIAV